MAACTLALRQVPFHTHPTHLSQPADDQHSAVLLLFLLPTRPADKTADAPTRDDNKTSSYAPGECIEVAEDLDAAEGAQLGSPAQFVVEKHVGSGSTADVYKLKPACKGQSDAGQVKRHACVCMATSQCSSGLLGWAVWSLTTHACMHGKGPLPLLSRCCAGAQVVQEPARLASSLPARVDAGQATQRSRTPGPSPQPAAADRSVVPFHATHEHLDCIKVVMCCQAEADTAERTTQHTPQLDFCAAPTPPPPLSLLLPPPLLLPARPCCGVVQQRRQAGVPGCRAGGAQRQEPGQAVGGGSQLL